MNFLILIRNFTILSLLPFSFIYITFNFSYINYSKTDDKSRIYPLLKQKKGRIYPNYLIIIYLDLFYSMDSEYNESTQD